MNRRVALAGKVKRIKARSRRETESEQGEVLDFGFGISDFGMGKDREGAVPQRGSTHPSPQIRNPKSEIRNRGSLPEQTRNQVIYP